MRIDEKQPPVAVLIPCYGDYSGLASTLRSVLEQSYPVYEIVLSDDGSGIPFPKEILSFLDKSGSQVYVRLGEKNLGTPAHLNLLAQICTATYLKFIAPGDTFSDPYSLEAIVQFAVEKKTTAVTSCAAVVSADLKYYYYDFPGSRRGNRLNTAGEKLFSTLAASNIISAAGTLLHRDFFDQLGGFDEESYRLLEDWPAWLRLAREGYQIPYLDRITCCYAVGGISSSSGNAFCSERLRPDMLTCYEKEILPFMERLPDEVQKQVRYGYGRLTGQEQNRLQKLKNYMKRGAKWFLLKVSRRKNNLWSAF